MALVLTEKQNEFIRNANRRFNIKVGAVRSGKSFGDMAYVIPARLRQRHGLPGLNFIIGVSTQTIERNVLQPMREIYTSALVGNINSSTNIAMICGEPVYCIGAEKSSQVAKIQGASIKYCYGDEVAKWSKDVFEMLKSRLDKNYSCFDGTLNPDSPNHWLKKFIDDEELDLYVQHYTIYDNPYLSHEFVENLCKEYEGTVYYKRYILGEWALAEGLIYPMYEHCFAEAPKETPDDECLSIDYGTMNAFAAILWQRYGDVWCGVDEYYYSGRDTGTQKTDEEYFEDLCDFVGNRKGLETIIDPSAASFIALLRKQGNGRFRVKKADNAVLDGIRMTATALKRGIVKIAPYMSDWRTEAGSYAWDEDAREDTPIKENDHLMDAMRYFIKTKRIGVTLDNYVSKLG